MKMRMHRLVQTLCVLSSFLFATQPTWGAGKKAPAPPPSDGKRVVTLSPLKDVLIEMPNHKFHDFGEDFNYGLVRMLTQSGRYVVNELMQARALDYYWPGSMTPVATIRAQVDALTFQTGARGERAYYGFDERFHNAYGDGTTPNEFPLPLQAGEPSWFGNSFANKGTLPFDSRSGLDIGDGFALDFLMAWLTVKYARYHAELHMKVFFDLTLEGITQTQEIAVKGDGFFFDVAGAYQNYSAGIMVARNDAMLQAVKKALNASYERIDEGLKGLPLMAKIDAVVHEGEVDPRGVPNHSSQLKILLGTGPFSDVKPGVLFQPVDGSPLFLEVETSGPSGSVSRVKQGDPQLARVGMVLRQVDALALSSPMAMARAAMLSADVPFRSDSVQLADSNIPQADLSGQVKAISRAAAFFKSILENIFLPYRIWRYYQYDRSYQARADSGKKRDLSQAWAHQVGLDSAAPASGSPIVAVVDSGMDYNHPLLHENLWINPNPWKDPEGRTDVYGWDFVSGDSRPADDHYHGTELASLIATVAPGVRLMPLKVFNPWGVTSSASLYGAFVYAVDHGASVILCGWATEVPSQALEQGVAYARDHGVVVVTAAGDQGRSLNARPMFPAALAARYDNVVVVTAVDATDHLMNTPTKKSNFGSSLVAIAAPGMNLVVADPRAKYATASSTELAAALVTGALARIVGDSEKREFESTIKQLLDSAESVSGLETAVRGGLRLRLR